MRKKTIQYVGCKFNYRVETNDFIEEKLLINQQERIHVKTFICWEE